VLDVALILLTTLHFLAANIAVAAPFIAVALEWKLSARNDALAGSVGKHLVWASVVAALLAGALGIGVWQLVARMYPGPVAQALAHLPPDRMLWGWPERIMTNILAAGVFVLLMLLVRLTWNWGRRPDGTRSVFPALVNRILAIAAATNLTYHLPVLFAVLTVLSTRPEWWTETPSFLAMLSASEVWVRVLHGWIAAVAVGGGWLLVLSCCWPTGSPESRRVASWGGWLVVVPTMLQLLVGAGMILALPIESRFALFGEHPWAGVVFVGSLLATFAVLHSAMAAGSAHSDRSTRLWAVGWLVLVVLLMTATRHAARDARVNALESRSPGFKAMGTWNPEPEPPPRRPARN
jgi:hypothetical protein